MIIAVDLPQLRVATINIDQWRIQDFPLGDLVGGGTPDVITFPKFVCQNEIPLRYPYGGTADALPGSTNVGDKKHVICTVCLFDLHI